MAIDKFDLAILMILQEDARASLQEISKRVGLSSTPCWTRIKRMESEGVIQGYTVKVDPIAIGLTDTVIVQVTLETHSMMKFARNIMFRTRLFLAKVRNTRR